MITSCEKFKKKLQEVALQLTGNVIEPEVVIKVKGCDSTICNHSAMIFDVSLYMFNSGSYDEEHYILGVVTAYTCTCMITVFSL